MAQRLEEVYRQIPQSTCPPDCGECCGLLLPSLAELRQIKDWCSLHHIEYKDFNMTVGQDCPYLTEDKKCLIYPVRPFLCRGLGVFEDLPCPLGKLKPSRVLNHFQSNSLYKIIYLHGKDKPRTERHAKVVDEIFRSLGNTSV